MAPRLTISVVLGWLLAAPALAHAQADSPRLFSLGARGGLLTTSWDYTEGDEFFDRGRDFTVGGFLGIGGQREGRLSLGLLVDVLYARQRIGDTIIGRDLVRELMHVPILVKVRALRLPGGARVYGVAGPAFDVQTRATLGEEDVTDLYEDNLLSIVAGGGVEWRRWSVDARVAWGRGSVPKDLLGPGEIRANTFAILGGFRVF